MTELLISKITGGEKMLNLDFKCEQITRALATGGILEVSLRMQPYYAAQLVKNILQELPKEDKRALVDHINSPGPFCAYCGEECTVMEFRVGDPHENKGDRYGSSCCREDVVDGEGDIIQNPEEYVYA